MAFKTKKIFFSSSIILGSLVVLGVAVFVLRTIEQAKADSFLSSDFNQDGIVDTKDIDLIKQNYANTAGGIINPSPYDLNNDHKINSLDLAIVEDNQGNGTNPDRDWDKDGWTVTQGDCSDRDSSRHPLAKETPNSIDDDCDGKFDELIDYVPLASSVTYDIHFSFSAGKTGEPVVLFQDVNLALHDSTVLGHRGFGDYMIEVHDSNDKVLDTYFFQIPNVIMSESLGGSSPGPSVTMVDSGEFSLSVPKTDSVSKLLFLKKSDAAFKQVIDVSSNGVLVNVTNDQGSTIQDSCPAQLRGDGYEKYYGVLSCVNFNEAASEKVVAALIRVYSAMKSYLPGVIYIPINKIVLLHEIEFVENCGTSQAAGTVYGCYSSLDNLYLNVDYMAGLSSAGIDEAIAHELGHHFYWSSQASSVLSEMNLGDIEQDYMADLITFLAQENCKGGEHCNGNIQEFVGEWPKKFKGGCEYLECSLFSMSALWNEKYNRNPVGGSFLDFAFPRPDDPGAVSAYAATSSTEEFAETIASIYDSYTKETTQKSYKQIIKAFRENSPPLSITGLTVRTSLLGKYGLIKDWDHDGVPDDYDNCSPKTYAAICKPGVMDKCYNPNQEDFVNHDGTVTPNGIGDQCEFQGQDLYFATCYKGMVPAISWQNPNVPNCPAPDYTNGPDNGFCTSPRILASIGGVGVFSGDEVTVKKAICEAAGEMPAE